MEKHSEAIPYRPRYELIAEDLVGFILSSGLREGERLPTEIAFGERFGVSRAIVHDAIKLLTANGIVQTRRGSGLFVGTLPTARQSASHAMGMTVPERMDELFEFRGEIEALTTQFATARISMAELRALEKIVATNQAEAERDDREAFLVSDTAFHVAIAAATHNAFYIETVQTIMHSQRWVVRLLTGGAPGSLDESSAQHIAIFQAMSGGQTEAAVAATRAHITSVYRAYQIEARRRLMGDDSVPFGDQKRITSQ